MATTAAMEPESERAPWGSLAVVLVVLASAMIAGTIYIGPIVVAIVGGAGLGGLAGWLLTTFRRPAAPERILPLYLTTIALLMLHILEEYLTGFAPHMAETFGIPFTEHQFVAVFGMAGFVIWIFGGVALFYRHPLGNYLCWFIFVGMVFAELSHFVFPLAAGGPYHYFSGMATALLPLIPAAFGMVRLVGDARQPVETG